MAGGSAAGGRTTITGFRAPAWKVWTAMAILIAVWGPNFLGIRVMVRTMPALLGSGSRYAIAGLVLLVVLAVRTKKIGLPRAEFIGCAVLGVCITGANALTTLGLKSAPAGLTGLIVALAPLVVIFWRTVGRETISRRSYAAVAIGLVGVVILVLPGKQTGSATFLSLSAIFLSVFLWTGGSYWSPMLRLPEDAFLTTAWFMLLGGINSCIIGLAVGEGAEWNFSKFSLVSVAGYAYVIIFGSIVGFTTYMWLIKNAPISFVFTQTYVSPVIGVILGWAILGESITWLTLIGAAIILTAVILGMRAESARRADEPVEVPSAAPATASEVLRSQALHGAKHQHPPR